MTEFLAENSAYIVLAAALLGWLGISGYMMITDKKLDKLEKNS